MKSDRLFWGDCRRLTEFCISGFWFRLSFLYVEVLAWSPQKASKTNQLGVCGLVATGRPKAIVRACRDIRVCLIWVRVEFLPCGVTPSGESSIWLVPNKMNLLPFIVRLPDAAVGIF